MSPLQFLILQILNSQAEGYICSIGASAFVSEGLTDTEELNVALIELQNQGLVEYFVESEETTVLKVKRNSKGEVEYDYNSKKIKPILDENGNVQTEVIVTPVDEGWIITEAGRQEVAG